MRRLTRLGRLAIVVAMAIGLIVAAADGGAAQTDGSFYVAGVGASQDDATLEIHKAECHTGVGPDIYEECHQNAVEGVTFDVNGAIGITDEFGYVAFFCPPGTVTITEDPAVFSAYLGAYVYCRDFTDDEVLYDDSATDTGGVVTLELEAGEQVVCDWYDILPAPEEPEEDYTDEVGGVTELPNTGTGSTAGLRTRR